MNLARFSQLALAALFFALVCPPTIGNEDNPQDGGQADAVMGMMLSDGLIKAMLKRTAYELSSTLELDEAQSAELKHTLTKRWIPFFRKHGKDINPVVDRMMQALWDPELPSASEAQAWAQKALKVQEILAEEVEKSNQDVAKLLKPEQRARFQKETARFKIGMDMFKVELQKMEQGRLADTLWAHRRVRREERRRRRHLAQQEQPAQQQASPSPGLIAVSVDQWEKYVIDFVEKFALDEAQKRTASAILEDVRGRARKYSKSRVEDLKQVEQEYQESSPGQREKLLESHNDLFQPLIDLFSELKADLMQIPTEAQHHRVENEAKGSP